MPEHLCIYNKAVKIDNYEIYQYNQKSSTNLNHGSWTQRVMSRTKEWSRKRRVVPPMKYQPQQDRDKRMKEVTEKRKSVLLFVTSDSKIRN